MMEKRSHNNNHYHLASRFPNISPPPTESFLRLERYMATSQILLLMRCRRRRKRPRSTAHRQHTGRRRRRPRRGIVTCSTSQCSSQCTRRASYLLSCSVRPALGLATVACLSHAAATATTTISSTCHRCLRRVAASSSVSRPACWTHRRFMPNRSDQTRPDQTRPVSHPISSTRWCGLVWFELTHPSALVFFSIFIFDTYALRTSLARMHALKEYFFSRISHRLKRDDGDADADADDEADGGGGGAERKEEQTDNRETAKEAANKKFIQMQDLFFHST
ncbi:hypothetical protein IWX90DRAFT_7780 [Phyllosticta citrichinensis]|uniref:Uncharacterized protein n=1 Tax=Phyllosticta citrichinensis TaxID=1130410 RepID=A0ABR1Y5D9_9PEZI